MTTTTVFVRRSSGGGCFALMIILLVFPVLAIGSFVGPSARTIGGATILGLVALAFAVWQLIRAEHRVELQGDLLRYIERETWFGVARPETIKFEITLDDNARVTQVNTRTPSSRGGWNYGSALHFPTAKGEHNAITDDVLGSREDPNSEYNRLIAVLEQRLGERFTVEEKV